MIKVEQVENGLVIEANGQKMAFESTEDGILYITYQLGGTYGLTWKEFQEKYVVIGTKRFCQKRILSLVERMEKDRDVKKQAEQAEQESKDRPFRHLD